MMLTSQDPKEFNEFMRLLRTITPENKGLDRDKPHWQTCRWIWDNSLFKEWKEAEKGGLLFITGNPGCGKSNLAKYIQGVMESSEQEDGQESLVVSFYCDSLESSRANPPILDWIVKFLLSKRMRVSHSVRQKLQSLLDTLTLDRKIHPVADYDSEVRFNHLLEVVNILMEGNAVPTCLVIDGLDQCDGEFILKLLRGLDTMFRREGPTSMLKVVITARLTDIIRGFAFVNRHVQITPQLIGDDIQRVVDEEIDRIILARQIMTVGSGSVSAVIVERANGSFLFASSVLKELWLIKDTGANSVFTLVTSCPSTMEAIYQQDMDRLEKERPDLFTLIQFLAIARKTLRLPEAREILQSLNPDITQNHDLVGDLTRMCQRLVKVGSEDSLELLHQTLYDFIINTYDTTTLHKNFAEVCFKYISDMTDSQWDKAIAHRAQRKKKISLRAQRRRIREMPFPFLFYASVWMGFHWRNARVHGKEKAWQLWDFLRSEKGQLWQTFCLDSKTLRALYPMDLHSPLPRESSRALVHDRDSDSASGSDTDWEQRALGHTPSSEWLAPEESDSDSSSSVITSKRREKPPLIVLAQWDVDDIIKEIFFEALETSPRQLLQSLLSIMPFGSANSQVTNRREFKRMVNEVWGGTTAVHYAAAQSGGALEALMPFVDDVDFPDDDGATPLILASGTGEIKGVKLLLEAGAEVDHFDNWHHTALYSSLHSNSAEVVRSLLDYGADPNIPSDTGHTPLEVAIGKNDAEYARIILEFSPDMKAPMSNGQPPQFLASKLRSYEVLELLLPHVDVDQVWRGERLIHCCVWDGLEAVVRKLIRLGANLDDPPDKTPKATPVALAAECGHSSILKALLAAGAKVECPMPRMSGPLHIAASRGYLDVCRQLIRAGCDIEAENELRRTALYIACDLARLDIAELLVENGADLNRPTHEPPLLVSADVGNLTLMDIILGGKKTPNINARGKNTETALGIAANFGDIHQVSLLLDHGADPNLRSGTRTSNTPLQLAATNRHRKTAIELLRRGADPYPENPKESSAFHLTCYDGYIDVLETFLDIVDNVDELVNFEWGWYGTPLMQAALGGQLESVQILLSKGADPNFMLKSKINHGKTILHAAAEGGNVKVFEAILDLIQEPDLEVKDRKQRTPLYYACLEGREDMVEFLLEKDAKTDVVLTTGENLTAAMVDGGSAKILKRVLDKNPDMDVDVTRNTDGKTPLLFAVMHGRAEIISILLEKGADVNRYSEDHDFALAEAIRYREKSSLKVLLEHEATDLTQKDVYGRNALQIAQDSGSHPMPGMIFAAIKTPELEAEMTQNRDMYGMNAFSHTLFDSVHRLPFAESMEGIRREAQSLLDDFALRGFRWERLGKYLLQIPAYSFAQVAFQRSVEAVEFTPLFLEHQVHCRLCLDVIYTTRYTCKTCCNTDLCGHCITRYPSLGYRMWTCQNHSYYQVQTPGFPEPRKRLWPRSDSVESYSRADILAPIEEGSEEDSSDERPRERQLITLEEESATDSEAESEADVDASVCIIKMPNRDDSETPPPSYAEATRRPSSERSYEDSDEDEGERGRPRSIRIKDHNEWVERTEEELRQFLEAILQIFTVGQTPERLAKWEFSVEKWRPEYDRRTLLRDDYEFRHPNVLHPTKDFLAVAPPSDAYNLLSGLAYHFANTPDLGPLKPRHEAFYTAFAMIAARKRRHLHRLVRKVVDPERPFQEGDSDLD